MYQQITHAIWEKGIVAFVGGFLLSYFSCAPDNLRILWLWLIVLFITDTVLGLIYAIGNKNVNSNKLWHGLKKMLCYMSIILVAGALDAATRMGYVVANIVGIYILLTEGISILENVRRLGVPTPKALDVVIDRLRNEVDSQIEQVQVRGDNGITKDG